MTWRPNFFSSRARARPLVLVLPDQLRNLEPVEPAESTGKEVEAASLKLEEDAGKAGMQKVQTDKTVIDALAGFCEVLAWQTTQPSNRFAIFTGVFQLLMAPIDNHTAVHKLLSLSSHSMKMSTLTK